eukprot:gene4378-5384_t
MQWINASTVFAVGGDTASGGIIVQTSDGGKTWIIQQPNVLNMEMQDLHFFNSSVGWVVGGYLGSLEAGKILRTQDGGETWQWSSYTPATPLYTVFFTSDGRAGWAAGAQGRLLYSGDGGVGWLDLDSATSVDVSSLVMDESSGVGFLVGEDGSICWSENGGQTWTAMLGEENN